MISKKILWETTIMANLSGHITEKKMFKILKADTTEKQQACLLWIKNNGKKIILNSQPSDILYNQALEIFKD